MILLRLHNAVAAVCPIEGLSGEQSAVSIDYAASATQAQKDAAADVIASFDWTTAGDLTWMAQQSKAAATAGLDALQSADKLERLVRSVAFMTLDELNLHTTFEAALLAAIAAATSLADLKTRAAAITAVPQRTQAQVISAIKAKIAATAE